VCCPSTFRTRFPYYHNILIQVICLYLLEIFSFCFALADIISFSIRRVQGLARFMENGTTESDQLVLKYSRFFQPLNSMLFSDLQFAFNRSKRHEEATTSPAFSVKKLTASMPRRYSSLTTVCLLHLFESANDYNDQVSSAREAKNLTASMPRR
jgi:hypothetical protein